MSVRKVLRCGGLDGGDGEEEHRLRFDAELDIIVSLSHAAGISSTYWSNCGGEKSRAVLRREDVVIASIAQVGVCAIAGRVSTNSSDLGGENESTTAVYSRVSGTERQEQNTTHSHRGLCGHPIRAQSVVAEVGATNQGE
jgi:hypothetical protein